MELSIGLAVVAVPVALLGAATGLAFAYNRLRARHERIERDRASYLEVLEGSNDGLFVINFVNGRIYQANEKAASMLGYAREELQGLTIFQLHPDSMLHRSAERIADAWEQKGAVYDDVPMLTASGAVLPVESSARVTSYDGRPAIILCSFGDMLRVPGSDGDLLDLYNRAKQDLSTHLTQGVRSGELTLPA